MSTVTGQDLFGFEYGPGMPQPVDIRRKRLGSFSPRSRGMYFVAIGEDVIDRKLVDGSSTQERVHGVRTSSMSDTSNGYGPLTAEKMVG